MVTYAERPWTKHYDAHVPASLAPYPDKLIHDYLPDTARKFPERIALITTVKLPVVGRIDSRMSYREQDETRSGGSACRIGLQATGAHQQTEQKEQGVKGGAWHQKDSS